MAKFLLVKKSETGASRSKLHDRDSKSMDSRERGIIGAIRTPFYWVVFVGRPWLHCIIVLAADGAVLRDLVGFSTALGSSEEKVTVS